MQQMKDQGVRLQPGFIIEFFNENPQKLAEFSTMLKLDMKSVLVPTEIAPIRNYPYFKTSRNENKGDYNNR
jgi:hypothetical protein